MSKGLLDSQESGYLDYLPRFKTEKFHRNGSQNARRWLMDPKTEFRNHDLKIPASPSLWVEALFRETDEEAARIVDNYEVATGSDPAYLEQSLKDKFCLVANVESSKSASEVLTEFAQLKSEPFFDFYRLGVAILGPIFVSDRHNNSAHETLSGAEEMVLDVLIKALMILY
ncbi:hypothetical protein EPUL_003588 [Erysiphe pulchra]|uniref:Uncharacterized protein n=1 Tax=Erysiphe pulchra TaxID=225359 RepID=A0A2S4PNT3_9PEZI|nr:hypothetical protein EPUL_003588 [Erysiphe pulchra]